MARDIGVEIMIAMVGRNKPMPLAEIARAAGVSIQAAKYAVGRLVDRGVVLPVHLSDHVGMMFYEVQPIFKTEGVTKKIADLAGDLATYVKETGSRPRGEIMLENLKMLLELVTLE